MSSPFVDHVIHDGECLAIIIRSEYQSEGIKFFTPSNFSQQLGYMNHDRGHLIAPHVHNPVVRDVSYTKEVVIVKSGKVRVDFYGDDKTYIFSKILVRGDIVLLAYGGHGFEMLEKTELIEVKQGPYAGDEDKTRFLGVSSSDVFIKE